MQLTPNYNLKKPEGIDPVDIQDFNDNADILDAELNKKADSSGGDISNMTIKALDEPASTQFPVPEAGETSKTFLGKIRKFMNDFKSWNTGVCMIGQIVNNCVTNNDKLPLSAAQGKVLMDLYSVLNTNKADKSALNGIMAKRVYTLQITVKPHSNIDDNPYPINWTAETISGYTPTWAILSGGDRSFIHSLRWINGSNIQTVTYNHYNAALTATVTLTVIHVRNGCI